MLHAGLDAALRPVEVGRAQTYWVDQENGALRIPVKDSSKGDENWTTTVRSERPGVFFFALIVILAGVFTTIVSTALPDVFPNLGALLLSLTFISVFLNLKSYSR